MPVRYTPGGDHHEREEYSYYTRDLGPRNFARSRRFVEEDGEESRTMSLVSNPLQVPMIGRKSPSPSKRPISPQRMYHPDVVDRDWEESRGRSRQVPRRDAHAARGACYPSSSNRNHGYGYDYEFEDTTPMQPLVPTYQPRRNRLEYPEKQQSYKFPDRQHTQYIQAPDFHQHPDYNYENRGVFRDQGQFEEEEVYHDDHENYHQPQPQRHPDHEIQSILNWRKRPQEPLVHTDFGYEVPTMRKRADPLLQDAEDNYKTVTGYIAKRRQFAVENDDDMQYYRNPNYQYRVHGIERPLVTAKDIEESMERHKIDKAPMFEMKLRSHVVWEKMNVKFTCTVRGSPTPRVTWYKNMVPLEPSLHTPGKYKISHQFGLHTLEICRATIEDSGTYRVSLQNRKGEISSYATLLVRRYDGGKMGVVDVRSGYNMRKPTDYPDVHGLNVPGKAPVASKIDVKEYDELPDTDAARNFKTQLDNLDFDVNKLIKEAKFDKNLQRIENTAGIDNMTENLTSQIIDGALVEARKGSSDVSQENSYKIFGSVTFNDNERRNSGVSGDDSNSGKGYMSDVSTDNSENSTHKNRFKVAIEVNITNENRRDSLDCFEKLIAAEKKTDPSRKESGPKENMAGDTDSHNDQRSQEVAQNEDVITK